MFYIGWALLIYGAMRLVTAVAGTVRLDRQVSQLTSYQQTLQYKAIRSASTVNQLGFIWSFFALLVGGILLHSSLS